ncbi:sodium:proton antiporter [Curtobacterium flaccumfaciens]|uniref:Sodium:proton antiporter n=1 Tax=Curtobacterium poinsettiae TaxID=159612 RepID=A0A9Q9PAV0_9MICO|nr:MULTISPECIES: sodium:proton antiporter [Curtobacterium]MBO9038632.1 sodium:proton antiporter [Curtobacterium flaccumfaciens pv. flaccumfaciens]MCS6561179.1 sodium:proton antiporter [Curtobacterium flaccumfaciens pv. poinsettiae]MDT0235171.1 sodium:proton antiporter [Curtobacterium sp. BRB10]UXN26828.1 sodium:proton antiporter [Curtobacterium flaccumfaciens]UXN29468.1 sodium:proton antiporter [Curtobacterium flaccumfaciens]
MSPAVVVMGIAVALVLALLGVTFALAVFRIVRGPTILDRMIGSDMVLTTVLVVIAAAMVIRQDLTGIPVLVVISATSVFATVAVARAVTPSADPSDEGLTVTTPERAEEDQS